MHVDSSTQLRPWFCSIPKSMVEPTHAHLHMHRSSLQMFGWMCDCGISIVLLFIQKTHGQMSAEGLAFVIWGFVWNFLYEEFIAVMVVTWPTVWIWPNAARHFHAYPLLFEELYMKWLPHVFSNNKQLNPETGIRLSVLPWIIGVHGADQCPWKPGWTL